MSNCYRALLAKSGDRLKFENLTHFLEPWHRFDKYANKIFYFLKTNCFPLDLDVKFQLLSKANYKTIL